MIDARTASGHSLASPAALAPVAGSYADDQALRASEQRHRRQIERSLSGVFRSTIDGRIIECNQAFAQIFGYESPAELCAHSAHVLYAQAQDRQAYVDLLLQRGTLTDFQLCCRRKDGAAVWIIENVALVSEIDGTQVIEGTIYDVTQRHRAEQALRESEERFRTAADHFPHAFLIYDAARRIQFVNKRGLEAFGISESQALGRRDEELFPPEANSQWVGALGHAFDTGAPHSAECALSLPVAPGALATPCWVVIQYVPLLDEAHQIRQVLGIWHDITERKRTEESLRSSSDLHRLMLRELDHRVRNNLASLCALIDISAASQRDVKAFADSIRRRVQAMSAVHGLLSRGHWISVDLRELLTSLAPADLLAACDFRGPSVAIASRQVAALGMVVQELIANSLKHGALQSPHGRVTVSWSLDGQAEVQAEGGAGRMALEWTERGGRRLDVQPREGVGTGLIRGLVGSELRGQAHLSYSSEGADHRFILTLERCDARAARSV